MPYFPKKKLLSAVFVASLASFASSTHANTMLGAYVDYDGWSVETIDQLNADSAKPMAVVNLFTTFDNHWDSLNVQASNVVSRGAMPMITLMPYSKTNTDMLSAISNGEHDAYITSWIESFKNWRDSYPADAQPTVMLRFGHEFNGRWYPWGNNPEGLKSAWRHMHNLFEQAGVNDSVEWVWCANNVNVDDVNDITQYYPGDDVVDWTSIDGYNWGSNYSFTQWKSFDETFSAAYVQLVTNYPNKPVVIAEVGSAEPHDLPNPEMGQEGNDSDANESKEAWVADMYNRIMTDYPGIRAVAWFNTNKELSWALNQTAHSGLPNTGLASYNQLIQNTHYTSTFSSLKGSDTPTTDTNTETNTKKGKSGGGTKGGGKNKTTTIATAESLSTASTRDTTTSDSQNVGIAKALEMGRMPAVVGQKLLEREANGFKNLLDDALDAWRAGRLENL